MSAEIRDLQDKEISKLRSTIKHAACEYNSLVNSENLSGFTLGDLRLFNLLASELADYREAKDAFDYHLRWERRENDLNRKEQDIRNRELRVLSDERRLKDEKEYMIIMQKNLASESVRVDEQIAELNQKADAVKMTNAIYRKIVAEVNALLEADYEKRMKTERKSREKAHRSEIIDRVNEALARRNREVCTEIDTRVNQLLEQRLKEEELKRVNDHEASSAIDVVVRTELEQRKIKNRKDVDSRMRLLPDNKNAPRHESLVCSYCRDNEASILFEPCNHLTTCAVCAPKVWFSTDGKCQLCNTEIVDFKRVYY